MPFRLIFDGNQTENGKRRRAVLESMGINGDYIEDYIQVEHILDVVIDKTISYPSCFDFIFRRVKMFADRLTDKSFSVADIISYLEYVRKENLQRRERYVTKEDIKRENIPQNQLVSPENIKLFDENIKSEIKYLKKLKKRHNLKTTKPANKFIWLGTFEQLRKMLILLIENDYIHNPELIENYIANFLDKEGKIFTNAEPQSIVWYSYQNMLTYFLSELTKHDIDLLDSMKIWQITSQIFVKSSGEKFKSLAVSNAKIPYKPNNISTIIQKVKNS